MTANDTPMPAKFIELFDLNPDGTPPELHPDLEPYLHTTANGIVCIKHPLVFSIAHIPQLNGWVNKQYEQKLAAIDEAEHEENWSRYLWLHERPHRLGAFFGIRDVLTDEQYWSFLSMIWVDTENMWQEAYTWRTCLESDRPGRTEYFMGDDDREHYAGLPDTFVIYRGSSVGNAPGMSWTLDRERAEWFARRYPRPGHKPTLIEGTVDKTDVVAYLGGRNESEIVVTENHIRDIKRTTLTL